MLNDPAKIKMAKRHFVFSVSTKTTNMMSTKFAFSIVFLILSLKTFAVNGSSSPLIVEDGVYSRVTVQIEPQPQPENCVEFLNQLEIILNETSYGLHRLTQQQAWIKDFQIILPKSWSVTACQPGRQLVSGQPASPIHPDLSVIDNIGTEDFANQPWTEQPGGCGQVGHGIKVPMKFINLDLSQDSSPDGGRRLYKNSWELRLKAQTLLREWSKYRYGVFPETGFEGDIRYPNVYKEGNATVATRGCPQRDPFCPQDQSYDRSAPTKQNLLCHGVSALETILKSADLQKEQRPKHVFEPFVNFTTTTQFSSTSEEEENATPTYFPITSIETTERPESSTLERRRREVRSPVTTTTTSAPQIDVTQSDVVIPKVARDPAFNYIVPRTSRYVLLLDRSSSMAVNGRWTTIQRALYRFVSYLPVGSELSIITFGSTADLNLPPTVVTDTNREGLHGRIPRKVLENDDVACTYCALNASLGALQNFMGQLDTGSVILVTGSSERVTNLETIMKVVDRVPIQVFPVLYPGTAHPDIFALAAHGKAYAVPEGENVSPSDYLLEILLDIFRESEGLRIQKVHEARVKSNEFAGTFVMEPDMLHKMSVTLTVDDENKVELFEMTNPSGKKHLFSQFEDGMVVFRHPGIAQTGIWTYYAKLYANTVLPPGEKMTVDVVSSANSDDAEPFLIEVFTSSYIVDAYKDKVVIYAKLTKGVFPVTDANVVAKIFRPGGQKSSGTVALTLRDNGFGDPDITSGDGIYSAYFSDFAAVPGYYSIQVSADDNKGQAQTPKVVPKNAHSQRSFSNNPTTDTFASVDGNEDTDSRSECCGSAQYFGEFIPASPFHRQAVGPAIYVKQGLSPRTDVAPPSRILDLRMKSVTEDSLYVTLEWSAPGDNYDQGRAASYEIRCYTSRDALTEDRFSEMGILVHSSFTPTPLDYGQQQTCTVGVPWPNEVFYYALVAFDSAGNRSPISNIISVYIYEAPTTTTTTTTTTTVNSSSDGQTNDAYLQLSNFVSLSSDGVIINESVVREKASHTKVYIATGVVCGLLILIIAVIVVILVRVRTKRSQYNAEARDSYRAYEPTPPTGGQSKTVAPPSGKGNPVHHADMTNTSKNLSNWLDSLPRSETGPSPNTTAHDLSMSNSADLNGTLNRRTSNTHTLTKTNPYRHKVLTNGSFLNLNIKESPVHSNGVVTNSGLVSSSGVSSGGSDNGSNSSRPTTSTEDNNSESESSNLKPNGVNTASVISLRRSNTTLSAAARHISSSPEETVLPPPDAFGNSSNNNNRGKVNYSTLGRYPIDTSTAKAIIDTYSGNLFSRSSNYLSFRDRQEQLGRSNSTLVSPDRLLNTNFPNGMDADSLEVYPVTPGVYSPATVMYNNNLDGGWEGQTAPHVRTYSKKTRRTESVV